MKQNKTKKERKQELLKLIRQVPRNSELARILKINLKYGWY